MERMLELLCQLLDYASHPYRDTIYARNIHDHEGASGGKDVARTAPDLTLTRLIAQSACLQVLHECFELTTYLHGYGGKCRRWPEYAHSVDTRVALI